MVTGFASQCFGLRIDGDHFNTQSKIESLEKDMLTEEQRQQITKRLDAEAKRQKESKVVGVWRPILTEAEKEERQKQIDAKEIPF